MVLNELYIYGAGGFGQEIKMIIDQINEKKRMWSIAGFIDDNKSLKDKTVIDNYKVLGDASFLLTLEKEVDAVLAIGDSYARKKIFDKLKANKHISFPNIFHPSMMYEEATLKVGKGNVFLINTIFSTCVEFGDFNVVNMGAIIGHHVKVGSFTTINPGCNIGGGVTIGDYCDLGMGCSVLQCVNISSHVSIGGNSLVIKDCEPKYLYIGIPAKRLLPRNPKL